MKLSPIYISFNILKEINDDSKISIHSRFETSINLKINTKIVNLSCNENILPPYGIVLRQMDFHKILDKVGAGILPCIHENNICFEDLKIALKNTKEIYYSSLDKHENNLNQSGEIWRYLLDILIDSKKQNGFDLSNDFLINPTDDSLEIEKKIEELVSFFKKNSDESIIKYFLGRGRGLTPSGDDFIVGIMSVFSCYKVFMEPMEKLSNFINKFGNEYTNDISLSFLESASQGLFSRNILNILSNIENEKKVKIDIDNLLYYGETSGVDLLLGIIFAYKIMDRSVSI